MCVYDLKFSETAVEAPEKLGPRVESEKLADL